MPLKNLYITYHQMVYNVAMQYVQNIEDAEEITQDVFVKINDKLHTFKNQATIKTWIYRIAINTSLDFIKAKKSKKRWFFLTALSLNNEDRKIEVLHFNHPGVVLEQKEELETIFAAINQLPDKQKTIIILLKIEHKSQAETAEIMNITTKAVEGLFHRAKINLQKILNTNKGK
jgi:RNA polymerase sigma factor (sigma-70 family)